MDNPQNFLDKIAATDTYKFLDGLKGENWANHRILLYLSLELTKGNINPVVEYGAGIGSSPYLRDYCKEHGRTFLSYDSNEEWAAKCDSIYVEDWGTSDVFDGIFSVGFLDLSPGYYRKRALELMRDKCQIITVHDTELFGAGDYQIQDGLNKFRYRLNYNVTQGGAGVSVVSDFINLSVFDKCTLNRYLLEV